MMNIRQNLLVVLILVAVAAGAFMVGRYAERIDLATASTSLQVNQFRSSLTKLRQGNQEEAIRYLEEMLDFHICILDQQMHKPEVWRTIFVPKLFRDQATESLSLFVDYRRTLGTNYTGMHITEIPSNATAESAFQIRRSNLTRNAVNKRIREIVKEN